MLEVISIPEERKAVLIGREGRVKKEIERKTGTKITVSDDIEIQGGPLDLVKAKEIIKAIGRGFSPARALRLLDEGLQLSVISLKGDSPKKMKRLLARVIGRKGLARERIEELTGCHICIYGRTISLIGTWEEIEKARKAVGEILEGKPHSNVYRNLARG
jgi:ribosomal RNA assembly protein